MSKFYKKILDRTALDEDNSLVTVKHSLKLIENSEYYDELVTLFKIREIENEPVSLTGLNLLISSIIRQDQQFEKIDYQVDLCDVSLNRFTPEGHAVLNIILTNRQAENNKPKLLIAETAYNSKSDYFESIYKLDSFARFCHKEGHVKLLQQNIEILNEYYKNSNDFLKSFRILKDSDGNYIRAITSTTHYNDYGNRFSLFVAIISLKTLMATKNITFKISRAEYDESAIKVFLKKLDQK